MKRSLKKITVKPLITFTFANQIKDADQIKQLFNGGNCCTNDFIGLVLIKHKHLSCEDRSENLIFIVLAEIKG